MASARNVVRLCWRRDDRFYSHSNPKLEWILGRIGFLTMATIGSLATDVFDLPFLIVLVLAIAREIVSGKNWRNLPVVILI